MTFSFLRLAFSLRPGFNNALVDYVFSYYSPLLGVESFSGVWMVDVSCELCRGCACVCRQPALRWFGSTSHHLVCSRKCIFILFHCLLRVIPSTSSSRQLLLLVVGCCCCCFSLATLALIVEIGGISSCSTSSEKLISFLVPSLRRCPVRTQWRPPFRPAHSQRVRTLNHSIRRLLWWKGDGLSHCWCRQVAPSLKRFSRFEWVITLGSWRRLE